MVSVRSLSMLRHSTLRGLLARSHPFPLQARRFLDESVARAFLKRSGVHHRLLAYCADTAARQQPEGSKRNAQVLSEGGSPQVFIPKSASGSVPPMGDIVVHRRT
jgi:hypothetical protein